jgi:hypothetical protein
MYFCDLVGYCHERRHGTERLASEIHVKAGYDDACAAACQFIAYLDKFIVEELGLVNAYDIDIGREQEYACR